MASYSSVFCLLVLFLCSWRLSSAATSPANYSRIAAERLIRSLNLSPREAVNIDRRDTVGPLGPRLEEWSFSFPGVKAPGGPTVENLGRHAGYFSLRHTRSARMFYYFFNSRGINGARHPVVIWISGGPGCSTSRAFFYDNCPFRISSSLSLSWNVFGWDKVSNIIFVDQTTGTGFSYTNDKSDMRTNSTAASNDLYNFLQAFFKKHPELVKNDFFIVGVSYAGHTIPALASRISKGNKAMEGIHINLKGFAIGNGMTNPEIQYAAYPEYAQTMNLINQTVYNDLNSRVPSCQKGIRACQTDEEACETSLRECKGIADSILRVNAKGNEYLNKHDVRMKCEEGKPCYDFSAMVKFLKMKSVKAALGVGNIKFVSCNETVYEDMRRDIMKNLAVGIPALLKDGIRVLIYAGEYDLQCNWLGILNWVEAMQWSGQVAFGKAQLVPFVVGGAQAGLLRSSGPLSFLKVSNAGHLVTMDQPEAALQMLKSWMKGKVASS